jgi:hypothetical protein
MDNARQEQLTQEIMQAFQGYGKAFAECDIDGINQFVSYPLAYTGDGQVVMVDEWPIDPTELKASKGWHGTTDVELKVNGVNESKAHLTLSGRRLREDGSPIEEFSAFYTWKKENNEWRLYALSDVVMPL